MKTSSSIAFGRKCLFALTTFLLMIAYSCYAADNVNIYELQSKIERDGKRMQSVEKLNDSAARELLAAREQLSYAVAEENIAKGGYDKATEDLNNATQSRYSAPETVNNLTQLRNSAWQNYSKAQTKSNSLRAKVAALEKQYGDYTDDVEAQAR